MPSYGGQKTLAKDEWEEEMRQDRAADEAQEVVDAKLEYLTSTDWDFFTEEFKDDIEIVVDHLLVLKTRCKKYEWDFDDLIAHVKDNL